MSGWWLLLAGLLVPLVLAWMRVRALNRLFSVESFRDVYERLVTVLRAAERLGADPPAEEVSFVSREGLAMMATCGEEEGRRTLHVSISQAGGPTLASVAGRFAFFVVAVLEENEMELTPYFTRAGVHHLRFVGVPAKVELVDFERAYAKYRGSFSPLPFGPAPWPGDAAR